MRKVFFKSLMLLTVVVLILAPQTVRAEVSVENITMSFTVEPMLSLKAKSSTGSEMIEIGPLVPGLADSEQTLTVEVVTNSEKPYRIYQQFPDIIQNASGTEFPRSKLKFSVSNGSQGGSSQSSTLEEIPFGRVLIFSSRGGADSFFIRYVVDDASLFEAGSYLGNVRLEIESV